MHWATAYSHSSDGSVCEKSEMFRDWPLVQVQLYVRVVCSKKMRSAILVRDLRPGPWTSEWDEHTQWPIETYDITAVGLGTAAAQSRAGLQLSTAPGVAGGRGDGFRVRHSRLSSGGARAGGRARAALGSGESAEGRNGDEGEGGEAHCRGGLLAWTTEAVLGINSLCLVQQELLVNGEARWRGR